MIDIHCHILPNVDDGAKTMQESIEMIRNASNAGVEKIILTPHFILGSKYNHETNENQKSLEELKREMKSQGLEMPLYLGNEVFYEENLYSLVKERKVTTLNNSRYLLFEIPRHNQVRGLEDAIFNLKTKGITPILAHPERYEEFQKHPDRLLKLKEMDLLFQCNIGSFSGGYGKEAEKLVKLLSKHHLIDFLGTDSHHSKHNIYKEYEKLKESKWIDNEYFELLTSINPQRIINNEEITNTEYSSYKKTIFGKWK